MTQHTETYIYIQKPPGWKVEIRLRDASLSVYNTDFESAKIIARNLLRAYNSHEALLRLIDDIDTEARMGNHVELTLGLHTRIKEILDNIKKAEYE